MISPLPDIHEIPEIGSRERTAYEEAALARGRELLHECEGSIRDALDTLEQELRGKASRDTRRTNLEGDRLARRLVDHVEQCWASAVLR